MKFILRETTEHVSEGDVFKTNSTGMPDYDDLLTNNDFSGEKHWEIKTITPEKYFNELSYHFNVPVEDLIEWKITTDQRVTDKLINSIKSGHKLNLPVLDTSGEELFQEGAHRVGAFAQVFGWDTPMPTLFVSNNNDDNISHSPYKKINSLSENIKLINQNTEFSLYQLLDEQDTYIISSNFLDNLNTVCASEGGAITEKNKSGYIELIANNENYKEMLSKIPNLNRYAGQGKILSEVEDLEYLIKTILESVRGNTLYINTWRDLSKDIPEDLLEEHKKFHDISVLDVLNGIERVQVSSTESDNKWFSLSLLAILPRVNTIITDNSEITICYEGEDIYSDLKNVKELSLGDKTILEASSQQRTEFFNALGYSTPTIIKVNRNSLTSNQLLEIAKKVFFDTHEDIEDISQITENIAIEYIQDKFDVKIDIR